MIGASFKSFPTYRFGSIILLVLVISVLFKLHFAEVYVTYTDEILSAIVAQSISETGLPYLPSGTIYSRALLHHYLLALPVGLFGIDYLSMRINSIAFSVVTVIAIYLLGSRISSRWVAVFAVFILSMSALANQFALSGRMYMTYGALYTVSIYYFYGGIVRNKSLYKWSGIVFMVATMLSSEAGLLLGPVMVFGLIVYQYREWYQDKVIYVGFAIWLLLFWFIYVYDVPGSINAFTVHSGMPVPGKIHAQMPLREIIVNFSYLWRALDRSLPFSMPFFLTMAILVIKRGEFRQHYPLVMLLPALVVESFLTYRVQHRIIISILPLYILACCQFVETFLRWANQGFEGDRGGLTFSRSVKNGRILSGGGAERILIAMGLCLLFTIGIAFTNKIRTPTDLWRYIYRAFGYHDSRAAQNLEPAYQYLRSHLERDDTIIVTTVEYGLFLLGSEYDYYYLRQKKAGNAKAAIFSPFGRDKEPYYGRPLVDSIRRLQQVIEAAENAIWVVADYKMDTSVGPAMRGFISDQFDLMFDDYPKNQARVYRRGPTVERDSPQGKL